MKKSLLVLLFLPFIIQAQTKTTQPVKQAKPVAAKPAPAKDTSLCSKMWKLVAFEEWAIEAKPKKNQVDDFLWMTGDGNFKLKRNGEPKAGTWTRQGPYIFFTDVASGEKFNYKVESQEPKKCKLDYHISDLHTLFTFELK